MSLVDRVAERLRAAGCVFAEEEAALLVHAGGDLEDLVARRVAGVPLEHLLGRVAFDGLTLVVAPGVFVPRRRTEALVHAAAATVRARAAHTAETARPVVVDLCCGVGAIGAALCAAVDVAELHATEIDPVAADQARRNLAPHPATVYVGDLDAPLPASLRGRVDLLTANVPYVPGDAIATMPPEARDHEPRTALDGGADGLDVARRVVTLAPALLTPGGSVLIETSGRQAPALAAAMTAHGLTARVETDDERDATVMIGTSPQRSAIAR